MPQNGDTLMGSDNIKTTNYQMPKQALKIKAVVKIDNELVIIDNENTKENTSLSSNKVTDVS